MTAIRNAMLASTGQSIIVLDQSKLDSPEYTRILIPYSFLEKLKSRDSRKCHLQIVRKNRITATSIHIDS